MRRFHNPRFAPESLERKLNPSSVVPVPVAAEVYVSSTGTDDAAASTGGLMVAMDVTPDGSEGTDPPPPDGDGTPPPSPPIIPNGPGKPA